MLVEIILLGSYLYSRSKKNDENQQSKETVKADELEEQMPKSVAEEKMAQIVGNKQQRDAFKVQNNREILSATAGVSFATVGALFYHPLGLLSIPCILYTSRKVNQQSIDLLKQKKVSTDTLISITLVGATLSHRFFIASLISLLVRCANRLTSQITEESRAQLSSMFQQQTDFVWVLTDNVETQIPFEKLQLDDVVIIQSGEMIPADGLVVDGMASIDQHVLTGEANPVEREIGDEVFASTVVLSGKIYVKVEKAGEDCTVAKIADILNNTIDFKSSTQLRAEKFSSDLVAPALIAGGIAIPLLGFMGALAVINAHPKNKIMIIAPLTILNYLNVAAKNGLLIKDGRSLELLNQVDTVIFDKTGTLTEEQPHVTQIHCCDSYDEKQVLTYAAAAENKQKHPLARAILAAAEEKQLTLLDVNDSECHMGYGIVVYTEDKQSIHVGSSRFMDISDIDIPEYIALQQQKCHQQGHPLVLIALDKKIIGAVELQPTVREEAKQIIAQLKARAKIKSTYIISGDHEIPTQKLAEELGIDEYFAETLPTEKADLIDKLKEEGRFICYIGDGINDSIALKKSHVSISLNGAATIATDTAQIVLMDKGISQLNVLFDLAEDFNRNMDKSFNIMLTPAVIGVGGAFLLGFGLSQTLFLNMTGLALGIGNAMRPRIIDPLKQPPTVIDSTAEAVDATQSSIT